MSSAIIEGFASLFGVADGGGDTVLPGAFARSLRERGPQGVRFLFQHDPAQPIGRWLDLKETARGLRVRGEINLDVGRGRELAALVGQGGLDGLSIGFRTVSAVRPPRGRSGRHLKQVYLWEISLVTFPMLAGARVTGIMLPGGRAAASTPPGAPAATGDAAVRMARAAALLDMSNPTRN